MSLHEKYLLSHVCPLVNVIFYDRIDVHEIDNPERSNNEINDVTSSNDGDLQ